MAKTTKAVSFKNAVINTEDMTITEINKDDSVEYDLLTVLKDWNGIEGISLTIKFDDELKPTVNDGEDD